MIACVRGIVNCGASSPLCSAYERCLGVGRNGRRLGNPRPCSGQHSYRVNSMLMSCCRLFCGRESMSSATILMISNSLPCSGVTSSRIRPLSLWRQRCQVTTRSVAARRGHPQAPATVSRSISGWTRTTRVSTKGPLNGHDISARARRPECDSSSPSIDPWS